jgi:hypothetical protein
VSPVKYELGFYIPEDAILHSHRRESIKSYIALTGWAVQWRSNVSPVRCKLGVYILENYILHSVRRGNLKSYFRNSFSRRVSGAKLRESKGAAISSPRSAAHILLIRARHRIKFSNLLNFETSVTRRNTKEEQCLQTARFHGMTIIVYTVKIRRFGELILSVFRWNLLS